MHAHARTDPVSARARGDPAGTDTGVGVRRARHGRAWGSSGHTGVHGNPAGTTRACVGIQRGTDTGVRGDPAGTNTGVRGDPAGTDTGVRGDPAGTDTGVWGSGEHDGVGVPRANERLACKRG